VATSEETPEREEATLDAAPVQVGRPSRPVTQQLGRIAMIVAGGIFALFAIFNAQHVDFSWVFASTEVVTVDKERVAGGVPLILLLVVAFALGAVVGAGAWARSNTKRQHRALSRAQRKADKKR
jgi:hypothetical protein